MGILIFHFVSIISFSYNYYYVDNSKVEEAIIEYVRALNDLFSEDTNSFIQGKQVLLGKDNVYHIDDFEKIIEKNQVEIEHIPLTDYVRLYDNNYKNKISSELFLNTQKIHSDCPLISEKQSKSYVLVSMDRKIKYQNNGNTIEYIFFVNTTNPNSYYLEFILTKDYSSAKFPSINNCQAQSLNQKKFDFKKKQFDQIIKDGDEFYEKLDYLSAIEKYAQALEIFPDDIDMKDAIMDCNKLILENEKKAVDILIQTKKYKKALEALHKLKNEKIKTEDWYQNSITICKQNIKKIEEEQLLDLADSYYNSYQTEKAKTIYLKLSSSSFLNQKYITNKIRASNERTPYFVQSELNKAFSQAVKSKKNYLSTFRTYSKYESSGLLSGKQYYFMCLMMVTKHSTVAKPMGISKNKANILSRYYFYKAKNAGINVSYLENQIFTHKINKLNPL